jgi:hypothetical protein
MAGTLAGEGAFPACFLVLNIVVSWEVMVEGCGVFELLIS